MFIVFLSTNLYLPNDVYITRQMLIIARGKPELCCGMARCSMLSERVGSICAHAHMEKHSATIAEFIETERRKGIALRRVQGFLKGKVNFSEEIY